MAADAGLSLALQQVLARPWEAVVLDEPVAPEALPTPALVLDYAVFQRNVQRMARFLGDRGKGFRPHAKTHKCPLIARYQLDAGAVGVCAAKVSEAAVLVNAGVGRVLVTSPVIAPEKARLLAGLAARSERLDVVVDSRQGLEVLSAAADPAHPLGVLVDVDVAMGRTGTRSAEEVVRLADAAAGHPGLEFRGIQHYAGHLMHVQGHAARREKSLALWETVTAMVHTLTERGLPPEVVTGGGTGTYDIDSAITEITDLQVGSYVFMDQEYRLIGGRDGEWFDDFEVSLHVLATAISQPRDRTVTVDGGFKSFASDSVEPVPLTAPGAQPGPLAATRFRFAGDEHGVLVLDAPVQEPLLGAVQRFITPHCDPTVNLYDWYWICRDGVITEIWPIAARGCSW